MIVEASVSTVHCAVVAWSTWCIHPLYIVSQLSRRRRVTVWRENAKQEIRGVILSPRHLGVPFSSSTWILAWHPIAFRDLCRQTYVAGERDLAFPLPYQDAARRLLPGGKHATDIYFVYKPGAQRRERLGRRSGLRPLTRSTLSSMSVGNELRQVLGSASSLPKSGVFGLVRGGTLVCVADCLVDVCGVVNIQQVYTCKAHRGRGLATTLVRMLSERARRANKIVTYIASERNVASRRVAEHAGFLPMARWGTWEGK
jgi:GNAT superfamily N-acetyltransferase